MLLTLAEGCVTFDRYCQLSIAGAWLLGTMFDYFLIGFLFLLLSRNSIFALHNIFLYSALQLIVVISVEALLLARTGTTIGKNFLGLRVVSPTAPLDFNLAWKRTFWAYVKGLWLGIPLMMFVPAWFSRQVLRDSGSTIWDQPAALM